MDSREQFDTSKLSELFQNSTPSLIPESLISTIQTGILTISILGALFLVLYVFTIIRKWKVDSAILKMQKDIVEIKNQGIKNVNPTVTTSVRPEEPIE